MVEQMTARDALDALAAVVRREGRNTIRQCHYVVRETVGGELSSHCIVGCVLADQGVTEKQMTTFGSMPIDDLYDSGRLDDVIDLSRDAMRILRAAQEVQDRKQPWGKALAAARRTAWWCHVIGKDDPRRGNRLN